MRTLTYLIVALLFPIVVFAQDTYVVKKGDTLWTIARTQYGDASMWRIIYKANSYIGSDHQIFTGQILSLPEAGKKNIVRQQSVSPDSGDNIYPSVPEELDVRHIADTINDDDSIQGGGSLIEMGAAFEMFVGSLENETVRKPNTVSSDTQKVSSAVDSSDTSTLPVFSLVFVPQPDVTVKKKYLVSDSETLLIEQDTLRLVNGSIPGNDNRDKTRTVAGIIEQHGTVVSDEQYDSGKVYHIKRLIFSDSERYYTYILTNVNEKFIGFSTLTEPLDVLCIRIFSNNGALYLTDKGLQGLPGYYYAYDGNGTQIMLESDDTVIREKYDKAIDLFLNTYNVSKEQITGSDARQKLELIF